MSDEKLKKVSIESIETAFSKALETLVGEIYTVKLNDIDYKLEGTSFLYYEEKISVNLSIYRETEGAKDVKPEE